MITTICVYCASSDHLHPDYVNAAQQMGQLIAQNGLILVYGAGRTGLMGSLADGALQAGGEVEGVMPKMFATPELVHPGLTRLEVVDTIQQRKARLAELADAFIALPGGLGTFEELFEILTWAQIGLHHHPVGLLNVRSYFDPLLELIEHARREGFIYDEKQIQLTCSSTPQELLNTLLQDSNNNHLGLWKAHSGHRHNS